MKHASITSLLLLALALGGLGCGGDEPQQAPLPGGPGGPKPAAAAAAAAPAPEKRKNPSWDKVKKHFHGLPNDPTAGFVKGTIGNLRDPFEPQLVKFVPKVTVAEDKPTKPEDKPGGMLDAPDPPPGPPVEKTEMERFRTQDYRVLMIRWGTSVNKAVVQDPEGNEFILTKDMKLGSNNGRVTEITQYEVRVQEDNREDPIVISIEPEILKIRETEGLTDRLYTTQRGRQK